MCEINNTDFRDLLVDSLTQNGKLAKIRAELRAHVYLTLDDEIDTKTEHRTFFYNNDYFTLLFLIHDFLNHNGFEYTLSVFEAEADYIKNPHFKNREGFFKKFGVQNSNQSKNTPALLQVFQIFKDALGKDNKSEYFDLTYQLPSDSKSMSGSLKEVNDDEKSIQNSSLGENVEAQIQDVSNINECEISEEINSGSVYNKLCNEIRAAEHKNSTPNLFTLGVNSSDPVLFKDTSRPENNLPKNINGTENNILEKTLVMKMGIEEKSKEITSSSPLNNPDRSINLMKFEDSFGDISAVKTTEITYNEMQVKSSKIDVDKRINSIENVAKCKPLHQPELIANKTIGSHLFKKNQVEDYLKEDVLNIESPTKNICKHKLDNIHSMSLPSFYVNVSNIDGFDLDMDSLDNYEEDILSLSTATIHQDKAESINANHSSETMNTADHFSDRGLFTVSGQEASNPEKTFIGDGLILDVEKCEAKQRKLNTLKS